MYWHYWTHGIGHRCPHSGTISRVCTMYTSNYMHLQEFVGYKHASVLCARVGMYIQCVYMVKASAITNTICLVRVYDCRYVVSMNMRRLQAFVGCGYALYVIARMAPICLDDTSASICMLSLPLACLWCVHAGLREHSDVVMHPWNVICSLAQYSLLVVYAISTFSMLGSLQHNRVPQGKKIQLVPRPICI